MTVEAFLILLTVFSVATSMITEAAKKVYMGAPNIVAMCCSCIVSVCGSVIYYVFTDTQITFKVVCFTVLLIVANWLCSMLGYDKVMQSLAQIGAKK